MSKTFEELVADCFVAYVSQPKLGTMDWMDGKAVVPCFELIADGLVKAAKREIDFNKAKNGDLT